MASEGSWKLPAEFSTRELEAPTTFQSLTFVLFSLVRFGFNVVSIHGNSALQKGRLKT